MKASLCEMMQVYTLGHHISKNSGSFSSQYTIAVHNFTFLTLTVRANVALSILSSFLFSYFIFSDFQPPGRFVTVIIIMMLFKKFPFCRICRESTCFSALRNMFSPLLPFIQLRKQKRLVLLKKRDQ